MEIGDLDQETLNMSREGLLQELVDQIDITREMMNGYREELKDLKDENWDLRKTMWLWKYTSFILVFAMIAITIYLT